MSPSHHRPGTALYFAYGANMDPDELTRRVGAMEKVGKARLDDHRLVFNRDGHLWKGGVSSVVEHTGETVFGVLWRVTGPALKTLDAIEDPAAYARVTKTVVVEDDGQSVLCQIYVAYPEGERPPAPAYIALLLSAAEKAELPADYIAMLRAHRDRAGG